MSKQSLTRTDKIFERFSDGQCEQKWIFKSDKNFPKVTQKKAFWGKNFPLVF
jgi:hypothetical protein